MENITTYVHSIDPFAIQFTENIGIRWYGLAYLAGIILGYVIIMQMIKLKRMQIKAEVLGDFATWMAFGILIGGRLGYCLFYAPHLFWEFESVPVNLMSLHFNLPLWGVLAVHKGGMASHGGIIGVSVACYMFARKHNLNLLHCLDITVLGGALGFFFGRIANFINGELYGRPIEKATAWAVKFPQEIREWSVHSPKDLVKLSELVENIGSIQVQKEGVVQSLSVDSYQWISWVSSYRANTSSHWSVNQYLEYIMHQATLGNQKILDGLQTVLTPRYPSQLYQAVLEGLLVFIILNLIWLKPRKPGVIAASFGFLYALARILGEQYRMPDAELGFQFLNLTRGQWLSVGMMVFAGLLLWYSLKQNTKPLGGWTPGKNSKSK